MKKTEQPQISPALFFPLMELDTIKKGTTIYFANDQKEVHWQHTKYILLGDHPDGFVVKDTEGKTWVLSYGKLDKCYVYKGHVTTKNR